MIQKVFKEVSLLSWVILLFFTVSILGLGYIAKQSAFMPILIFFSLGFIAYFWVLNSKAQLKHWQWWLGVGVFLRFLLLFGMPTLSDDIYRFIWDGRLINNGINPFISLPADWLAQEQDIKGINQGLFDLLNSPNYFTIYPPVAQGSFAIASFLFFKSILGNTILLKLFLFICEMGSLLLIPKLLKAINQSPGKALIYALNPLIIVELVGNLHYEAALVFFLLLALYWLQKGRWLLSAFAFALSIGSKLLSILFLPFLWSRFGWKKSLQYYLLCIGFTLLLFAPLINTEFIQGFSNSLDLYFRKFEFNGSIYYFFRWLGYQWKGYNIIQTLGPRLGAIGVLAIGLSGLLDPKKDFASIFSRMLFAITLYLALATTIHPWYTTLPLVLCLFTRFRFPVLWTALICFTYANYSYEPYRENLWIVGVEYALVYSFALYEIFTNSKKNNFKFNFFKP